MKVKYHTYSISFNHNHESVVLDEDNNGHQNLPYQIIKKKPDSLVFQVQLNNPNVRRYRWPCNNNRK
jgi:hypothetical protein